MYQFFIETVRLDKPRILSVYLSFANMPKLFMLWQHFQQMRYGIPNSLMLGWCGTKING